MPYNADAWAKMSEKLDANSPSGSTSGVESVGTGAGIGAVAGGLESIMKDSLESVEMPYNPAAWDAMRGKLDAKMPVEPTGGSNFKWIIAAAGVTGIVVASYFFFSGDHTERQTADTDSPLTEVVSTTTEANGADETNTTTTQYTTTNVNSETITEEGGSNPTAASPSNVNGGDPSSAGTEQGTSGSTTSTPTTGTPSGTDPKVDPVDNGTEPTGVSNPLTDPVTTLVVPAVADLCEGESFTVENVNDAPLLVLGTDLYFIIPAHESRTVRTKQSGIHSIGALDAESETPRNEFMVKDAPNADFLIDPSTKFENGLPTTKVESTVPGTDFEWIFNSQRVKGQTADAHFYTKGNHNITLTVTGSNGCKTSVTKPVFVDEHYNLMAMNSFRPNSTDPSTNTFMPYALKERDVRFTMIIIDPTDGHIIYQTSDASQGWNGNDSKTGRAVQFETSYIWKVTIENTATNEVRNEYSGHVIPVHSSN